MFVRTHIFSEGFGMRQMLTITMFHPCFYSFLPTDSAEEPIIAQNNQNFRCR